MYAPRMIPTWSEAFVSLPQGISRHVRRGQHYPISQQASGARSSRTLLKLFELAWSFVIWRKEKEPRSRADHERARCAIHSRDSLPQHTICSRVYITGPLGLFSLTSQLPLQEQPCLPSKPSTMPLLTTRLSSSPRLGAHTAKKRRPSSLPPSLRTRSISRSTFFFL